MGERLSPRRVEALLRDAARYEPDDAPVGAAEIARKRFLEKRKPENRRRAVAIAWRPGLIFALGALACVSVVRMNNANDGPRTVGVEQGVRSGAPRAPRKIVDAEANTMPESLSRPNETVAKATPTVPVSLAAEKTVRRSRRWSGSFQNASYRRRVRSNRFVPRFENDESGDPETRYGTRVPEPRLVSVDDDFPPAPTEYSVDDPWIVPAFQVTSAGGKVRVSPGVARLSDPDVIVVE